MIDRFAWIRRAPSILAGAHFTASVATAWLWTPSVPSGGIDAAFGDEVSRAAVAQTILLFPLGMTTVVGLAISCFRSGGLASGRGRLQAAAAVFLFAAGLLTMTVLEPLLARFVEASGAAPGRAAELFEEWRRWRFFLTGLSGATLAAALAAMRLPEAEAIPGASVLNPRQRLLLFLLGAATFFEGYDRFIVSLALPYIADDLGGKESDLGFALGAIRIGALFSIAIGRLADRHGRRRLLLATILAYTVCTAATGLSRGLLDFVAFQFLANIFLLAELSLAQVVVAEEFPSSFRAKGQAILGAFAAVGAGTAAMLFPVMQATSLEWRGLYFVGILPLLLIAFLRRTLPETERFERARALGEVQASRLGEILAPGLRGRFLALVVLAIAMAGAAAAAFSFASYRATKAFGWPPEQVSAMILVSGTLGLGGWYVFGQLAERVGRRFVGLVAFVGSGASIILYFQTDWLRIAFALLVFMEAGAMLALAAFATELFPTRMRSTAKAWITAAGFVGAMLAFGVVGGLAAALGGIDPAVTLVALAPILVAPVALLLPEPRGRELEDLSNDVVLP